MSRARRPLTAGAAALVLAVALSGCSLLSASSEEQAVPTVAVPVELPVTFSDEARWTVELGTDTRPAVTQEGIAVILPGRTSSSLYRVALLAPDDGAVRWVSDDFENPTPDVVPTVSATTVGGSPWVVVSIQTSANQVQLDTYSPTGTGDRRTPDTTATITGTDDETVPSVSVQAEGVVVSQVEKTEGALMFNPATGKASAYEGPGELSAVWAEGSVVTNPSKESGFGYTVGGEVAWQSSTSRPADTDRSDTGSLLTTGPGILLAEWTGTDGEPVLAVHEIRTGKVLAVQRGLDSEQIEATRGEELVHSADGAWAAWGGYVFGLKGGPSSYVDLHGGTVRAIYQDVLYVENATVPLTASAEVERQEASPSPSPSDGGGDAEPSPDLAEESGETFDGMIDATTGEPLTNEVAAAVPLFVSNASQGVFVLSTDGKTRLYSAPLS